MPVHVVLFVVALVLNLVPLHTVMADQSSVRIIVNNSVDDQSLDLEVLRNIYGKRIRNWPDGQPITVFVLADNAPTHTRFTKEILHMFPYQLRWAWNRLVFAGLGQSPQEVGSEEEMLAAVENTPGAIGYITKVTTHGKSHVVEIN